MTGEHDLTTLLASMSPELRPGRFGYAHVPTVADAQALAPVMMFQELEAVTVILPWDAAEAAGLAPEFPCCWITLNIHSALDAVGFLARVSTRLAGLGMGVNPVAGFYHDHLFLPFDRADDAMAELRAMAAEAGAT
ncbi:MAG: ACT domain-containing protein [Pseudomonadota bacterium]